MARKRAGQKRAREEDGNANNAKNREGGGGGGGVSLSYTVKEHTMEAEFGGVLQLLRSVAAEAEERVQKHKLSTDIAAAKDSSFASSQYDHYATLAGVYYQQLQAFALRSGIQLLPSLGRVSEALAVHLFNENTDGDVGVQYTALSSAACWECVAQCSLLYRNSPAVCRLLVQELLRALLYLHNAGGSSSIIASNTNVSNSNSGNRVFLLQSPLFMGCVSNATLLRDGADNTSGEEALSSGARVAEVNRKIKALDHMIMANGNLLFNSGHNRNGGAGSGGGGEQQQQQNVLVQFIERFVLEILDEGILKHLTNNNNNGGSHYSTMLGFMTTFTNNFFTDYYNSHSSGDGDSAKKSSNFLFFTSDALCDADDKKHKSAAHYFFDDRNDNKKNNSSNSGKGKKKKQGEMNAKETEESPAGVPLRYRIPIEWHASFIDLFSTLIGVLINNQNSTVGASSGKVDSLFSLVMQFARVFVTNYTAALQRGVPTPGVEATVADAATNNNRNPNAGSKSEEKNMFDFSTGNFLASLNGVFGDVLRSLQGLRERLELASRPLLLPSFGLHTNSSFSGGGHNNTQFHYVNTTNSNASNSMVRHVFLVGPKDEAPVAAAESVAAPTTSEAPPSTVNAAPAPETHTRSAPFSNAATTASTHPSLVSTFSAPLPSAPLPTREPFVPVMSSHTEATTTATTTTNNSRNSTASVPVPSPVGGSVEKTNGNHDDKNNNNNDDDDDDELPDIVF